MSRKIYKRAAFFVFLSLASLSGIDFASAAAGDPFVAWVRIYDSTRADQAYGIAVYNSNDVTEVTSGWPKIADNGSTDTAYDVAVDTQGNIYVTGKAWNSTDGNWDYMTVKYDPQGNELWRKRFNSAGTHDDAQAIAVDREGNVYVTGNSGGNYRTIKYSAGDNRSGDQATAPPAWDVIFDSGGTDTPFGIAVDAWGGVYITGLSGQDYRTIKYSSSTPPLELWNKTFDLGNNSNYANDIALDAQGNVYVTGQYAAGGASSWDYLTVKYSAGDNRSGNEATAPPAWYKTYDSGKQDVAEGIAVDSAGNIYLTGRSGAPNIDYRTIKYDAGDNRSGDQLAAPPAWNKTFDGGDTDEAWSVAVDTGDNIYVTGKSFGANWNGRTIRYRAGDNRSGDQVTAPPDWNKIVDTGATDDLLSVAVDLNSNVYVTGQSLLATWDYRTVKYAPNDRVYVVGRSEVSSGNYDSQIVKYDLSGTPLGNTASGLTANDEAWDIAVASSGAYYVTGYVINASGNKDFRTVKYTAAGAIDTSWGSGGVATYDSGRDDWAKGIALDAQDNVYVTGARDVADVSAPLGFRWDWMTVKYDPTGARISAWDKQFDSGLHNHDFAEGIAVDASGDVYVTGYFCSNTSNILCASTSANDQRMRTVKYASSSSQTSPLWNNIAPNFGEDDFALDIAVDSGKNAYVVGYSGVGASPSLDNFRIIKYNALGSATPVWDVGGPSAGPGGRAHGVAVDALDDPYVTGELETLPGNYRTLKYASSTGGVVWERIFDYGSGEVPLAIAVDSFGGVYVTGGVSPNPGNGTSDFLTIKYGKFPGTGPACTAGPTGITWTDPITPNQTKIRKDHVDQLRAWINNQRQDVGLSLQSWTTDPTITVNETKVKAVHFTDMRTAIAEVYTACGEPTPLWTEPLTVNSTKIRASHLTELRTKVEQAP